MYVAQYYLTLHDTLYFATREMGTLYETERYIHNYALSYALFNDTLIKVPYFCDYYKPKYEDDLDVLNKRGIYVTPARPLSWDYVLVTWKMAQVTYNRKSEKFGGINFPRNFGRAKELSPGSTFRFFIVAQDKTDVENLPHWIRLGKWASKAEVTFNNSVSVIPKKTKEGHFISACPLNPLDVPSKLVAFDIISMPPVSLVDNALVEGEFYELDSIRIPVEMQFRFPKEDLK